MEQKLGGLKCDTPHCNYVDPDIPFEDYPKWIGKPCPVCGRSLLTQEDYDAFLSVLLFKLKFDKFCMKHKFLARFLRGKSTWAFELNGGGFKTAKWKKVK